MRKLVTALAACMLMSLALMPGAYAQGTANPAVVIGDGAPIPYLDGFKSRLIRDTASLAGITGAFAGIEVTVPSDLMPQTGTWRYALENLILTDDVLGVFFKQTYSAPIPYDGKTAYDYNLQARIPNILADGEPLRALSYFSEGRPIDACSQYSFVLWSLPQPVTDGQTLTFGTVWNIDSQAWEGGAAVTVDRSRTSDPTIAYTPSLRVQKRMALWEGNAPVSYDFTVARVAYTPFGNRILLRFRGTCEFNQYLDYQLLDENGALLTGIPPTQIFRLNASAEHPVWNENEAWFFGGEGSRSLTLVPTGGDWQDSKDASRTASVPLDSLPADVPLENGVTLHVESCALTEDGFYARYSSDGYTGYVSFDLGDANGNSLGLAFGVYTMEDPGHGLLGYGGSWREEYRGETVLRVTQEQLAQAKTLLIGYSAGCPRLIESERIDVALTE